jgi:hypothetical protein
MSLLESDGGLIVSVNLDELRLLASSIGEALEAVDEWEFSTRLGFDSSVARSPHAEINEILLHATRPE